jgi:hypothetical protein
MKAYRRKGDMTPLLLNLGTRWRWVARVNPLPLSTQTKSDRLLLNWRLDTPRNQSGRFGEEEELFLLVIVVLLLFLFLYSTFVTNLFLEHRSHITSRLTTPVLQCVCMFMICLVFISYLTDSSEYSRSSEANSCTAGQEVFHILCRTEVRCDVYKGPSQVVLSRIKSTPSQPVEC